MGTLAFSDLEVHPLDENFAVVTEDIASNGQKKAAIRKPLLSSSKHRQRLENRRRSHHLAGGHFLPSAPRSV
jgi:hypothetical protein